MTTPLPVVGKMYSVRLWAEQVLEGERFPREVSFNNSRWKRTYRLVPPLMIGNNPRELDGPAVEGTEDAPPTAEDLPTILIADGYPPQFQKLMQHIKCSEAGTVPHLSAEQLSELLLAIKPTPTHDLAKHAIELTTPLNGGYVILEPIPVKIRKIWKASKPESAVTAQDLIYLRECVKSYEDKVWRVSLPVPPTSNASGNGGGAAGTNGSNEAAGADEERGGHDCGKRKTGDEKDDSSKRSKSDNQQPLDDGWSDSDDDDEVTCVHAPLVDLYEDISFVYEEEGLAVKRFLD
ncbi:hypothetical protein BC832DRAFT_618248 [Gaertneriomyces semiglobifer]|nr:hypothetical protein BC832DRAFT_618248 [Gaertneriomyces semiglobifer]